ncbi:cysteine hydrolase [Candidatus Micrarchaeota archaeon]|nr:cysteine hydrolase [Candidatus Micrarchaeota archaeon]
MTDKYTKPDNDRMALITIDVQNDFTLKNAPLEIKGTLEIVPKIVTLLNKFREKQKPIIHVIRLYKEDGTNAELCRKKMIEEGKKAAVPGSEGSELVKELKPNPNKLNFEKLLKGELQEISKNEHIIYKQRWGAFYNTKLEETLRNKGVTTLVFAGCNFPNCPRTSIYEASERDFKIIVIKDAISGIYDKDMAELENIGCEIISLEDFMKKV